MNIIDNEEHEIADYGDDMLFVINNAGREYLFHNIGAPVIDYDIFDRIMKGTSIDTTKF